MTNVFFFFHAAEERNKPQSHLTNLAALQIVYDSEVYTNEYANPCSAFLPLYYLPPARSFLACRQVKDKAAARAIIENQAAPHHDIRHMSGINIKRLLPPPCVQAEASGSTPPGDLRKRKRKSSSKGETSHPEPPLDQGDSRAEAIESKDEDLPQITQPGIELDPDVPSQGPGPSKEPTPLWAPSYQVFRDPVRSDATVLRTGGIGSNTASALSEVARLPADMAVWKQSTNQEVIDNLRREFMMVSPLYMLSSLFLFLNECLTQLFFLSLKLSKAPSNWRTGTKLRLLSCKAPSKLPLVLLT